MVVRRKYEIAGPIYYAHAGYPPGAPPDERLAYYHQTNHDSNPINFTIAGISFNVVFQGGKKLIVTGAFPDDPIFLQYLTDATVPKNQLFEDRLVLIDNAAKRVLEIIRYIFGFTRLKEYLMVWSATEFDQTDNWAACVDRRQTIWVPDQMMLAMDRGTIDGLEELISDGVKPLHALKFLSKAKMEPNLHDRCIFLATAAEQAVKEFFERRGYRAYRNDEFKMLYTKHLRINTGTASPYAGDIRLNARLRNTIVHEPASDPVISLADSIKYADAVEKGILHLMTLLYPHSAILALKLASVDNSKPGKLATF